MEPSPDSEKSQSEAAEVAGSGLWSRLPAILLMCMILLGAGALSAVTAMRFAIQGREVEVPDLAGATEAEAVEILGARGLELVVDGRRFSSLVPDGEVLEQAPRAGARVKSTRSVRVRISLGERQSAVPELRGASLRTAQLLLVERGLTPGSTLYAHTPDGEAGTVLFQQPPAGSNRNDPAVSVLVSLGPVDQYFVMPFLTGMTAGEARRAVRDAGFRMSEVTDTTQSGVAGGRVVSQQPPPGTRIASGDAIVLGVSQ